MMEEELATSPVGSPTTADTQNKRKLGHLDFNEATDQHPNSEPNFGPVSVDDEAAQCEDDGGAVESQPKRPRLENNGGTDGPVSQDGYREEEKEGEIKVKESEHPGDENDQSVDGLEAVKEQLETITEEPNSGESENPEIVITEELQLKNSEEEPSEERPREGDVPVPATEQNTGSDTQILSRKMEIPSNKVGVLIGKQGGTIRSLQDNSGAKIEIVKDAVADLQSATRPLELVGTLHSINKAEKLMKDVIAEADAGGCPSLVAQGFIVHATGVAEQLEIQVPVEKVGFIIGKGGETIKNLQTRSGARIQQNLSDVDGDLSTEKTVRLTGNKKQIEIARDMIKDVMNQTMRPSPLSGGYNQQSFHPRGSIASPWVPRRPPHAQFSGNDYQQRGAYPSQGLKYPPPSYSNRPPLQSPRSNLGPRWEQRPPASMLGPSPQSSYNYGRQQGPNQPPLYSQTTAQPYGHGYNQFKYNQNGPQNSEPMGSQPIMNTQGVAHSGYGPHDQFKPPMYGMRLQIPPSQSYSRGKPNQPGEMPYHSSVSSYGQNVAPQQLYPYLSTGTMQQSYPPYSSAPSTGEYSHAPAPASASGYQQAPMYAQGGPTGGYGSYSAPQPAYSEQPAPNNAAYGYQMTADPAQGPAAAGYPAAALVQSSYPPTGQTQAGGYGNSGPSQSMCPQYDTSQMYGSHV